MRLPYKAPALPVGAGRGVAIFCLATLPLVIGRDVQVSAPHALKVNATAVGPKPSKPIDPRIERLVRYFTRLHCPVVPLASDFVRAADANQLDWRLLPGISVVESGGGKAYRNNNIFGWDNGAHPFVSVRSGIHEVAYRLGRSPLYRNRDSVGKLRVYNTDAAYGRAVLQVMSQISPTVVARPLHTS